ncbi:hypothetical protein Taro_041038 [Colocasia esculenta]|uniref:BHLH domain-containing protein n=1 Tax=Colocasia esculenta TaxID=4460 RepID=A0A843WDB4_COLES|nr:hypothetical protein [Colocasia esculenta]
MESLEHEKEHLLGSDTFPIKLLQLPVLLQQIGPELQYQPAEFDDGDWFDLQELHTVQSGVTLDPLFSLSQSRRRLQLVFPSVLRTDKQLIVPHMYRLLLEPGFTSCYIHSLCPCLRHHHNMRARTEKNAVAVGPPLLPRWASSVLPHDGWSSLLILPENELVELLWQNGHVVMHCQTNRKATAPEIKQCQKPEAFKSGGPLENSCNILHGEDTVSWLQYADDPLEKEFYSDLFYGLPATESSTIDKLKEVVAEGDKFTKYGTAEEGNAFAHSIAKPPNVLQFEENVMPPPKSSIAASLEQAPSASSGGVTNFSHFSKPPKADLVPFSSHMGKKSPRNRKHGEVGQSSSMMTKGSSFCASNHVQNPFDVSWSNAVTVPSAKCVEEESQTRFSRGRTHSDMHETAVTSSSGGSACSYGRTGQQSASMKSHKRKGRDADESECQSEEAEYESAEANRLTQRSAPARRSRAAEVHNLSERRRRDRINEKMKALQELIPHCNKVLLSVHCCHGPMPSIPGPLPFPRVPLINQSMAANPAMNQASVCPSPGLSPTNFQNQIQNIPESYARYLGFQHMQQLPQAMNLHAYGSQLAEKSQTTPGASSGAPCNGGGIPEIFPNIRTRKAIIRSL